MAFRTKRWTAANLLPVAFVLWTTAMVWALHMIYRLLPLLQLRSEGKEIDLALQRQGVIETVATQCLTVMMLICFGFAISTDPGSVPDSPEWRMEDAKSRSASEKKHTGEQRYCKWCRTYKPDRCHHCRVCNSCVLRMDHHCPWIANCIGFGNHKCFLLLVMYALINCIVVVCGMTMSVVKALTEDSLDALPVSSSWNRFLLVFGLTVSIIMSILLSFFFVLHLYLMFMSMTTIELCEKRTKGTGISYSQGWYENLKATLGQNPLLWLLPVSMPEGDGLTFLVAGDKGEVCDLAPSKGSSGSPLMTDSSSPASTS